MSQLQGPPIPTREHLTLLLDEIDHLAHAGPYSKSTKSDHDLTATPKAAPFDDRPALEP
jgi:hypothetical protein